MNINSGMITPGMDEFGNPRFQAFAPLVDEIVIFSTMTAATFWLWLIEERVKGEEARKGIVRD